MKNGKIIRYVSVCLMVFMFLSLVSCSNKDGVPSGYKLASNDGSDFNLYVPESWTVGLSEGTVTAYCSVNDPSSVSVMPGGLEYADSTVDDWWQEYCKEFESVYSEYTLIAQTDAKLGGIDAKKFVFTGKLGEYTYHFEITAAIKSTVIYMFTYTSTDELYTKHTDDVAKMLEYFSFR